MRIKSLNIENFRVFGKEINFDLSGDLIIIYGRNGVGKTSLFDAIEWCLFNCLKRFEKADFGTDILKNLFSDKEEAYIDITLEKEKSDFLIKRKLHGEEIIIDINNKKADDLEILRNIVNPDREDLRIQVSNAELFKNLFISSNYLGQETIRKFVSGNPKMKYESIMSLIGFTNVIGVEEKLEGIKYILETMKLKTKEEIDGIERDINEMEANFKSIGSILEQEKIEKISFIDIKNKVIQKLNQVNIIYELIEQNNWSQLDMINNFVVYISNLIRRKNSEAKSLGIEYKDLSEGLVIYNENKSTFNDLKKKKKVYNYKIKEASEQINTYIKELKKKNIKKTKVEQGIQIIRNQIETQKKEKELSDKETQKNKIEKELREKIKYLDAIKKDAEKGNRIKEEHIKEKNEIMGKLEKIRNQKSIIEFLHNSIIKYLGYKSSQKKIKIDLSNVERELSEIKEKKPELEKKIENNKRELEDLESEYESQQLEKNQLNRLLSQIKEFIKIKECPLCGYTYNTVKELEERVDERIKHIPESIEILAKKMKNKQENLNKKVVEIDKLKRNEKSLIDKTNVFIQEIDRNQKFITEFESSFKSLYFFDDKLISEDDINSKYQAIIDMEKLTEKEKDDIHKKINENQNQIEELLISKRDMKKTINKIEKEVENFNSEIDEIRSSLKSKAKSDLNVEELEKRKNLLLSELVKMKDAITDSENIKNGQDEQRDYYYLLLQEIEKKIENCKKKMNKYEIKLYQYKIKSKDVEREINKGIQELNSRIEILDNIEEELETLKKYSDYLKYKGERDTLQMVIKTNEYNKYELKVEQKKNQDAFIYFSNLLKLITKLAKEENNRYIEKIKPLIQIIFKKLYGHPLFKDVDIKIVPINDGYGIELFANYSSENQSIEVKPTQYFSEAQLNLFAISFFIGMSLIQDWSNLNTLLLDDPIQHFDELNELAFIDLVRNIIESELDHKQIIVSTCNMRFYKNIIAKCLYMNNIGKRLIAYRLNGISKQGPEVIRDI